MTLPPTDHPACGTQQLTKVYGSADRQVVAVNDVTVAIARGSFTAIMGPSGSGKSTLMHCMAGLDRPTAGSVFIGSDNIAQLPEKVVTRIRRDKVGFVFQSFNLLPTLTAEQNILLPLELAGRRIDPATRAWFDQLIGILGLRDRLTHLPSELSGGQQQRVAIARALLTRPDVVFADEPTGNLDSRSGAEVLDLLRTSVRELGQTVVMVTHDSTAAAYADRVVLVADGRIAGDLRRPTPETVQAHLDALREAALTGSAQAQSGQVR